MPSRFPVLSRILAANAQWASDVKQMDSSFFENSAKGQSPKVLWIGCADSRVPESVILATRPGEIFVHRNIANQVHPTDDSVISVITYAVIHLGVEHVVVAGHTECGGAAAALAGASAAPAAPKSALERWLAPLIALVSSLKLSGVDQHAALRTIVEENVKRQVENVASCEIIKTALASGKKVWVHGWVYELDKGTIKDLDVTKGPE